MVAPARRDRTRAPHRVPGRHGCVSGGCPARWPPGRRPAWLRRGLGGVARVPRRRGRGRRSCRGSCAPGPAHARRRPLPLAAAAAAAGPARRGGAPGLAGSCFLLPARPRRLAAGPVVGALAESRPPPPPPPPARPLPASQPRPAASPVRSRPQPAPPRCPPPAPGHAVLPVPRRVPRRDRREYPSPRPPGCPPRVPRLPPPAVLSPQPLAPCVPPLPLGLCLRERGRGRPAPPEPRGPWWPSLAAWWRRSLGSAAVGQPPKNQWGQGQTPR